MAMGNWKSRIISKRTKGSQTPGKQKGASCQADKVKKFFAKKSRAYKYPGYGEWCRSCDAHFNRSTTR
jgi:hypothetical protein